MRWSLVLLVSGSMLCSVGCGSEDQGSVDLSGGGSTVEDLNDGKLHFNPNALYVSDEFEKDVVVSKDSIAYPTAKYAAFTKSVGVYKSILVGRGDSTNPKHNRGFIRVVKSIDDSGPTTTLQTEMAPYYWLFSGPITSAQKPAVLPKSLQTKNQPLGLKWDINDSDTFTLIEKKYELSLDLRTSFGVPATVETKAGTVSNEWTVKFGVEMGSYLDYAIDARIATWSGCGWFDRFPCGPKLRSASLGLRNSAAFYAGMKIQSGLTVDLGEKSFTNEIADIPINCSFIPCSVRLSLVTQCNASLSAGASLETTEDFRVSGQADFGVEYDGDMHTTHNTNFSVQTPRFSSSPIPANYSPFSPSQTPVDISLRAKVGAHCELLLKPEFEVGETWDTGIPGIGRVGEAASVYAKVGPTADVSGSACADFRVSPSPRFTNVSFGADLDVGAALYLGAQLTGFVDKEIAEAQLWANPELFANFSVGTCHN